MQQKKILPPKKISTHPDFISHHHVPLGTLYTSQVTSSPDRVVYLFSGIL